MIYRTETLVDRGPGRVVIEAAPSRHMNQKNLAEIFHITREGAMKDVFLGVESIEDARFLAKAFTGLLTWLEEQKR